MVKTTHIIKWKTPQRGTLCHIGCKTEYIINTLYFTYLKFLHRQYVIVQSYFLRLMLFEQNQTMPHL